MIRHVRGIVEKSKTAFCAWQESSLALKVEGRGLTSLRSLISASHSEFFASGREEILERLIVSCRRVRHLKESGRQLCFVILS